MPTDKSHTWRLLDTGDLSAADNVALDQALLEARADGGAPNTLRFLRFSPPAVLVGYHQAVQDEVRLDYCRAHAIDVGRRITGGGAIYCDRSQLGWEIVAGRFEPPIPRRIEDVYETLCQGAVEGLSQLGVQAAFRPRNDIEVNGRKLCGTGGTDMRGALLFQGTLLVDFDVETMLRALRIPIEKLQDKELDSVRQRVTCLREQLGAAPGLEQIKAALAEGFVRHLGIQLEPGQLTQREMDLFERYRGQLSRPEYVFDLRRSPGDRAELRTIYRAPGGLIRVSLVVDRARHKLKSALLTGDFFASPTRAIFDLEAALRDAPADEGAIAQIVETFWRRHRLELPGVRPADVVQAVGEALDKLDYERLGLPSEQTNAVFTVGCKIGEMPPIGALLLPYCAKLLECPVRSEEGCVECGLCGVGEAAAVSKRLGLRTVTIQNYEHLEETLSELRSSGVEAFVGCCCQGFLAKHREDFERLGLPGILLDLDDVTCYELGEERAAHLGQYDRQTFLKVELLEQVLELTSRGTHAPL